MRVLRTVGFVAVVCGGACQAQKAAVATGVVTGHVVCSDTQKPARGAEVSLLGVAPVMTKDGNALRVVMTKTSLDGSFVASGLVPGDYYAIATMLGYELPYGVDEKWDGNPRTMPDVSKVMANFPVVHVVAQRTVLIDLTMKHGGVIAGRVSFEDGSPATEVNVMLQPVGVRLGIAQEEVGGLGEIAGYHRLSARTDDAGRYRVAGLPAGKYRVTVALNTQQRSQEVVGGMTPDDFFSEDGKARQQIFFYAPGVVKEADAKLVELHGDEDAEGVDVALRLDGLHTIRGRVLTVAERRSPSWSMLFLKDDAGFETVVEAEPDGSFHFDYIPEGTYKLYVRGREVKAGGKLWDDGSREYESVNTTVIVGAQDMVLDDFLLAERKKADAAPQ